MSRWPLLQMLRWCNHKSNLLWSVAPVMWLPLRLHLRGHSCGFSLSKTTVYFPSPSSGHHLVPVCFAPASMLILSCTFPCTFPTWKHTDMWPYTCNAPRCHGDVCSHLHWAHTGCDFWLVHLCLSLSLSLSLSVSLSLSLCLSLSLSAHTIIICS